MVQPQAAAKPQAALAYSCTSGTGEGTARVNTGKLVGRDEDSLVGNAEAVHTSKAK